MRKSRMALALASAFPIVLGITYAGASSAFAQTADSTSTSTTSHAPVKELFAHPQHPYTRALLKTIPSIHGARASRLQVIEGQPPILNA